MTTSIFDLIFFFFLISGGPVALDIISSPVNTSLDIATPNSYSIFISLSRLFALGFVYLENPISHKYDVEKCNYNAKDFVRCLHKIVLNSNKIIHGYSVTEIDKNQNKYKRSN